MFHLQTIIPIVIICGVVAFFIGRHIRNRARCYQRSRPLFVIEFEHGVPTNTAALVIETAPGQELLIPVALFARRSCGAEVSYTIQILKGEQKLPPGWRRGRLYCISEEGLRAIPGVTKFWDNKTGAMETAPVTTPVVATG